MQRTEWEYTHLPFGALLYNTKNVEPINRSPSKRIARDGNDYERTRHVVSLQSSEPPTPSQSPFDELTIKSSSAPPTSSSTSTFEDAFGLFQACTRPLINNTQTKPPKAEIPDASRNTLRYCLLVGCQLKKKKKSQKKTSKNIY